MIKELCYAKINLILNILYKRPDNFHEVDFIMTTVDLYDEVIITKSEKTNVICEGLDISINDNLAFKAYVKLKNDFPHISDVEIRIKKNIPMSAGMAGGSADAAGVLRGVNRLFKLDLTLQELEKYAQELGSDVSFCLYQGTLRARGRGEVLSNIDLNLSNLDVLVINPGFEMSTKDVYNNYIHQEKNDNINCLLKSNTLEEQLKCFHNDLQPTSLSLDKRATLLYKELVNYSDVKVMISGSGPTFLVFSTNRKNLEKIYTDYQNRYDVVKLCKVR